MEGEKIESNYSEIISFFADAFCIVYLCMAYFFLASINLFRLKCCLRVGVRWTTSRVHAN